MTGTPSCVEGGSPPRPVGEGLPHPSASNYSQGGFSTNEHSTQTRRGMLNPRIHHHAALDTTYSLHPNITFVSLLWCPDSAKHPTCFQEADHVLWPFTSIIGPTCAFSLQAPGDAPRVAPLDSPLLRYTQHIFTNCMVIVFLQPFIHDDLQTVGCTASRTHRRLCVENCRASSWTHGYGIIHSLRLLRTAEEQRWWPERGACHT